jgi:hypothetical protein
MPEAVSSVRTHEVLIALFIAIVIVTKFNEGRWTQIPDEDSIDSSNLNH